MQGYDVHQELAAQLSTLSTEQAEAVREYLRELSASGEGQAAQAPKYLTFLCCGQMFGLDIRQVIQIIRIPPITPLPESAPYLKGVISVRSEMIPVLDLRIRLGQETPVDSSQNCIVIITVQGRSMGILVDAIRNVEAIPPEEICPPPRQEERRAAYLAGIVKRDAVILLVDADYLFTAQDVEGILDLSALQAAQTP